MSELKLATRTDWPKVAVGDKVKFEGEQRPYTVRAVSADGRFVICTKPFNIRHTVLYSIIDFYNGWRGPDNMVFGFGYETLEQIVENMRRLESGDMELSHRRYVALRIDSINGVNPEYDHWTAPLWADRKRWKAEHEAAMARRASAP